MPVIGWLDMEFRWWFPVHQPVETADFLPSEHLGALREFLESPEALICGVCSYDPASGQPSVPVPYPCPAVRTCQEKTVPSPRTPTEDDGNYRPRAKYGGPMTKEIKERTKGRKF